MFLRAHQAGETYLYAKYYNHLILSLKCFQLFLIIYNKLIKNVQNKKSTSQKK